MSFMAAMLLLTLAVIELMARLTHHVLFDESGQPFEVDGLAREFGSSWRPPIPGDEQMHHRDMLHPFYGYIRGWLRAPLNVMPPREHRKDAVIVALMGGSVAESVAVELWNALFWHFLESGTGPVPILVDLGSGGYHQPQQGAVLANMIANGAQFDVVILLDGFNDVIFPYIQGHSGVQPTFPLHWRSLVSMATEQRAIVHRLRALRDEERSLLRRFDSVSALQRSAVFRVIWRFRLTDVERRIALGHHELMAAATVEYGLERHGPGGRYTEDYLRTVGARLWYGGSRLIAGLARRHGAEIFHFIQPNQHVPDSKPLSAEELAIFDPPGTGDDPYSVMVPIGYGQMREYGQRLREQGVHFFDLSWIYQDFPESLYMDSCCHLNKRGNELLADAMLHRITSETSLLARPHPQDVRPARPVPLVRGGFDIYHLGTALGYTKFPCKPSDTEATFLLHIVPVHEGDLPSYRSNYSFDNMDFDFADRGTVIGGRCVATIPLPHYPVAKVRTGQGGAARWKTEFSLYELAAGGGR